MPLCYLHLVFSASRAFLTMFLYAELTTLCFYCKIATICICPPPPHPPIHLLISGAFVSRLFSGYSSCHLCLLRSPEIASWPQSILFFLENGSTPAACLPTSSYLLSTLRRKSQGRRGLTFAALQKSPTVADLSLN